MQSTLHGQTLIQLSISNLVNCYLVREESSVILIDTAIGDHVKAMIQAGQKLGLAVIDTDTDDCTKAIIDAAQSFGLPITHIVLTHAHHDHVGSLDALHTLLPEAEVAITRREARLLSGDKSLDAHEPQSPVRGNYALCKTRPTRLLQEGDRIGPLEVIATPGHTPGHAAFLDTRDGTLIAGDAFQTLGGVGVAGTLLPSFPQPALATWDKPLALSSARKLRALSPSRLAVGHGPVLSHPREMMDRAIETLASELMQTETNRMLITE
jgi:glyoxylase-like metal-dependent hydrolase (beta-lactamase superfamily II)